MFVGTGLLKPIRSQIALLTTHSSQSFGNSIGRSDSHEEWIGRSSARERIRSNAENGTIVRERLRAVLEFSQFDVKTAANVAEAIHLIDTEAFDVLLSDLPLPEAGDGFTIVRLCATSTLTPSRCCSLDTRH
jgi:hypothetical protein